METDTRLIELQEERTKLKYLEKKREESYAFWMLFKYFGNDEPWWDDFIHDERIPWEQLKSILRPNLVKQPHMTTSREQGERLWRDRKQILADIDETTDKIDRLLEDLICFSGLKFREVALYYGATPAAVSNYLVRREWFVKKHDRKKLVGG